MADALDAPVPAGKGVHAEAVVTVDRPVEELYAFWRNPLNLPQVMHDIESVEIIDDRRAHWVVHLPGGLTGEFTVEVYTDVPNEVISWRSLPGSPMPHAGAVRFRPAPGDRGCEVQLSVEFVPPAGALGRALLERLQAVPDQYVGQFLREFKRMMETGEVATVEGQPSGRSLKERRS
jgi:uncharacterized membrane protein